MNSIQEEKQLLLKALYESYQKCLRCPLGSLGRKQVVFGYGNPNAKLMIIGEGPGKEEDEQGKPFVGKSGRLLTKALTAAGITREEIFISNVVKCRPPENRKPKGEEAATCTNLLLLKEIAIIKPQILCTLGSSATEALLGKTKPISQIRGILHQTHCGIILPTFHPAYLLRNPKNTEIFIKDLKTALTNTKG